ncbi:MAG TPA: carbohydrate porin [Acetobacteraceae bacterium]|nr:carbohydrate porin [Acetobacteraceae bacterium]
MPRRLSLLAFAIVALALPVTAAARSGSPQAAAASGLWEQDTLAGDWDGLRKRLADSGIVFGLQEQSEVWDNSAGGRRRGATYDGLTTASLQIDLDRLAGWSGATFFVDAFQIHGRGPSDNLVGNLQDVSNIEATRGAKLYDLWLEQTLLNGRLNVRLGQEGAADEMAIVGDAALFLNASFGFPAVPTTDLPSGGPNYPMAAPFVRVRYRPGDAITLVGAAFSGDPAPPGGGDPQRRDAGGAAFRLNDHALLFAELWYSRNAGRDAAGLPAVFKLGAWFDSGRFADPLYDSTGLSLANPASSGVPRRHLHDFAFYGILDQTVWRKADNPHEGVAVFLQVMGAPGDRNLSSLFVEAGLNWKAPIAGRDNDAFGLAVAYEGIGAAARRFSSGLAFFSGSGVPYDRNETVVEATCQYQVAPWWTLQPDAQYVVNPGAGIPAGPNRKPLKDAFIVGVRAIITF